MLLIVSHASRTFNGFLEVRRLLPGRLFLKHRSVPLRLHLQHAHVCHKSTAGHALTAQHAGMPGAWQRYAPCCVATSSSGSIASPLLASAAHQSAPNYQRDTVCPQPITKGLKHSWASKDIPPAAWQAPSLLAPAHDPHASSTAEGRAMLIHRVDVKNAPG